MFIFVLLLIFLQAFWPILIPFLFSLLYGITTKYRDSRRIFVWLLLNYIVSVISLIFAGYVSTFTCWSSSGICPKPGPFNFTLNFYTSLIPALVLDLVCLPFMYLGVWIKNLGNKNLKK